MYNYFTLMLNKVLCGGGGGGVGGGWDGTETSSNQTIEVLIINI